MTADHLGRTAHPALRPIRRSEHFRLIALALGVAVYAFRRKAKIEDPEPIQ